MSEKPTGNRLVDRDCLPTTGGTHKKIIKRPLLNLDLPSGVHFPNYHYGLSQLRPSSRPAKAQKVL